MKTVRNQQISDTMQNDIGDSVDEASRSIERELLFELSDNERVTLDQIEAALRKIDKGTYGVCESCQSPIAKARLDALPFARYCIDCQNRPERSGRRDRDGFLRQHRRGAAQLDGNELRRPGRFSGRSLCNARRTPPSEGFFRFFSARRPCRPRDR